MVSKNKVLQVFFLSLLNIKMPSSNFHIKVVLMIKLVSGGTNEINRHDEHAKRCEDK